MTDQAPPKMLAYSLPAAAKAINVSRTVMFGYVKQGLIPTFRLPNQRGRHISADDLQAFVEKLRTQAEAQRQEQQRKLKHGRS